MLLGGVKGYAGDQMNVLKWCLNRPHQAKHFNELLQFTGLNTSTECYKPLREAEIRKSENSVADVIHVLENEYLSPFSVHLDSNNLYNLSSGSNKIESVEELLCIWENGKTMADEFTTQRIFSSTKPFHDPIRRNKIPTFQPPKVKLSTSRVTKVIDANRNIIGRLLSISAKMKLPIDFSKALTYPLYGVPLCLAYPDGSRRETQKSKLLEVIAPGIPPLVNGIDIDREQTVFIIDMIAQIRVCATNIPDTFKEFILKFIQSIPKGYQRVDIVADTYRDASIKNQERTKRGTSTKVLIGSVRSKMPRDINRFMMNNENKTELIKLTFQYIMQNKEEILQILKTQMMILSGDNECFEVT